MCGIAGEINLKNGVRPEPYHQEMLKTLLRRGPDDNGIYADDHTVLIHARLAVVDPKTGAQPMQAGAGEHRAVLVYNGELYNTEQLRRELALEGETFFGHSDTEVLLKAYLRWGEEALQKFNGIFAFAVWEPEQRRLFAARDPMGVKPFFFAKRGGSFLFASELKTLLCHPAVEPAIDAEGISELLFIGPGRTPGCGVFQEVFELKPGECAVWDERGLRIRQYFVLQDRAHTENAEETINTVRELVTDAIRRQLVSDVPIGTFLSGGLDSSIISAIAAAQLRKQGERLKTFSVNYRDNSKYFKENRFQPASDEKYVKIMTDYLESDHTELILDTGELIDALYDAVEARDLPGMADIDSSLLLACKGVKEHVTVALSGECADEIFGGYPWYRDEKIREAYGFPWAQSTAYRMRFLHPALTGYVDGENYVKSRYETSIAGAPRLGGLSALENRMREMVYINMNWFMQTLLDRKDRMSMYSGLEVRVPFCDRRIAEYMYGVPWMYKDLEGREKGLLRAAMDGLLPPEILWRKKNPYPKTHNPAYLQGVRAKLTEILAQPSLPIFGLINRKAMEEILVTERPEPWYGQLMTTPQSIAYLLQLSYWMEKYRVRIRI